MSPIMKKSLLKTIPNGAPIRKRIWVSVKQSADNKADWNSLVYDGDMVRGNIPLDFNGPVYLPETSTTQYQVFYP